MDVAGKCSVARRRTCPPAHLSGTLQLRLVSPGSSGRGRNTVAAALAVGSGGRRTLWMQRLSARYLYGRLSACPLIMPVHVLW